MKVFLIVAVLMSATLAQAGWVQVEKTKAKGIIEAVGFQVNAQYFDDCDAKSSGGGQRYLLKGVLDGDSFYMQGVIAVWTDVYSNNRFKFLGDGTVLEITTSNSGDRILKLEATEISTVRYNRGTIAEPDIVEIQRASNPLICSSKEL